MARPQVVSDDAMLDAAERSIGRLGLERTTLADVAVEIGISPGTIVHRFGSKRGLLLSLLQRATERSVARAAVPPAHASPFAALLALGERVARRATSPEALAHTLAFLQSGLDDPEFRQAALGRTLALRKEIEALIRQAVKAGELCRCDTKRVARAVHVAISGSLLQWAIEREGPLASWVSGNVATILRPLATTPAERVAR